MTYTWVLSISREPASPSALLRAAWQCRWTGALNMKAHVSQICRSSYMHLKNIGSIRNTLTQKATETLVHAFITSRLDYCNSLLHGLPATTINKLQRIQNTAARIVTRTRKREHVTSVLYALHWLPVAQRITFKILTLTYQALPGQGPEYLKELIVPYRPCTPFS